MATSKLQHTELGEISVYRRRGLKNMNLRVDHKGMIKLSLPWFVPKAIGLKFITEKKLWLLSQQKSNAKNLSAGSIIGIWRLDIRQPNSDKAKWKTVDDRLIIFSTDTAGDALNKLLSEAIYEMAKQNLPKRLERLALAGGFKYSKVRISRAKTRWGSCSQNRTISLSSRLVCLPDQLVDYVILHELCHIKRMNHSQKFWEDVSSSVPDYKNHRKQLRSYKIQI